MADYYPLLAKAVGGLPDASPEARKSIYDRARQALQRQLRGLDPPVPEADIDRESAALENAVARLEAEYAPPEPFALETAGELAAEAQPFLPTGDAAAELAPREETAWQGEAVPAPASDEGEQFSAPEPEPQQSPGAAEPLKEALVGVAPADFDGQAPAGVSEAAAPPGNESGQGESAHGEAQAETPPPASNGRAKLAPRAPMFFKMRRETAPAAGRGESVPARRAPVFTPVARPASPSRLPEPDTAAPADAAPPPFEGAPLSTPLEAEREKSSRDSIAEPIDRAAAEGAERADAEPEPAADLAQIESETAETAPQIPGALVRARPDARRPFAPQPAAHDRAAPRKLWILGFVVGLLVLLVAVAAYELRDRPDELRQKAAAPAIAPETENAGKIVDRVGAGADASSQTAASAAAPAADESEPASSRRAALLVEAPQEASKVSTFLGTVSWKTENVSNGPGDPLSTAVRAEIDIPEEKLQVSVTFQKNFDSGLPASHTIKVQFFSPQGGPLGGVQQISAPQMRREGAATGDALAGVPVSITDNSFLVGLTRGSSEASNLDLLQSREWIDVPMLLNNGRIAKLTFEKGPAGTSAIDDALAVWKAQ